MKPIIVLLCAFICCFISGTSATFYFRQECRLKDFKVYNVHVDTADQFKIFHHLRKKFSPHIMREANEPGKFPFYLALEPQFQKGFELALTKLNIRFELLHDDLQQLIDEREKPVEGTEFSTEEMSWNQYHNLSTIESWIFKISEEHDFVTKRVIGRSYWWRPIYSVEISKKPGNKAIEIYANIHAIEWLSSATVTCFLDRLLKSDGKGDAYDYLLNNYDWIIVPVQNPDGFWFSHNICPMWRKTRSFDFAFNETGLCFGVDANRNYDAYWGQAGYNLNDECDHFFAGKKPETEPEVKAHVNYLKSFPKDYIKMSYHVHTFGQLVLRPYGHTDDIVPKNIDEYNFISGQWVKAATAAHGTPYSAGSSGTMLGKVSGATKDFCHLFGIPYAVTVELRDRGLLGFFVPPSQILDTCDEFSAGIYAAVKAGEEIGFFQDKN